MFVKTPLAVLVGLAVAIGVMVAPSAAATNPTPGRAVQWGNTWVPPQSDSYWVGEAGPGPTYLDDDRGAANHWPTRNTVFAA